MSGIHGRIEECYDLKTQEIVSVWNSYDDPRDETRPFLLYIVLIPLLMITLKGELPDLLRATRLSFFAIARLVAENLNLLRRRIMRKRWTWLPVLLVAVAMNPGACGKFLAGAKVLAAAPPGWPDSIPVTITGSSGGNGTYTFAWDGAEYNWAGTITGYTATGTIGDLSEGGEAFGTLFADSGGDGSSQVIYISNFGSTLANGGNSGIFEGAVLNTTAPEGGLTATAGSFFLVSSMALCRRRHRSSSPSSPPPSPCSASSSSTACSTSASGC